MKRTLMIAAAVLAVVAGADSAKAADVKMAIPGNNPLNPGLVGAGTAEPTTGWWNLGPGASDPGADWRRLGQRPSGHGSHR